MSKKVQALRTLGNRQKRGVRNRSGHRGRYTHKNGTKRRPISGCKTQQRITQAEGKWVLWSYTDKNGLSKRYGKNEKRGKTNKHIAE